MAFALQSNGAIRYSTTTPIDPGDPCLPGGRLFLDRSGSSLYQNVDADVCESREFESYHVTSSTGALHSLGTSGGAEMLIATQPTFLPNNQYAFMWDCPIVESAFTDTFVALKRHSSGLLMATGATAPLPPDPQNANPRDYYCRSHTAADPFNHIAVSMQLVNPDAGLPDDVPQLASSLSTRPEG